MRVLRERAADVETDREATRALVETVGETGTPAVRVWTPHRQVAFGRRDARSDGYEHAREAASGRGFVPVERRVGGRAVAYTGTTLAFALVEPTAEGGERTGIGSRYDRALAALRAALREVGVDAEAGEPERAFCPGSHSLSADGRKLVGLAQRIGGGTATVGGQVVVRDHGAISEVLEPIYDALGVPFDPGTVGSVARAGGEPDGVREAVERALVDGRTVRVETV
jgi:lipoate-protein ligase A